MNRLDRAKGRLAEVLAPAQRVELAKATLATVIDAVVGAGLQPMVLTADVVAEAFVRDSARVLDEDAELTGLNPQLERALSRLEANEVLILHADLPLASADALTRFVDAAAEAPSCTIVRSPDGGTNAMLLRPPGRFPLAYGRESAAKHEVAASDAGIPFASVESSELLLDLDMPADLEALLGDAAGRESRAGRLLREWGFGPK